MAVGEIWRLARPGNVGMAVLGVVTGGLGAHGLDANPIGLFFAALCAAFGVAGGNALNDAMDQHIDRAAHPRRPVARGALSPSQAAEWAVAFFYFALTAAYLTNVLVVLMAALLTINLLAYEFVFKEQGLPGHFLISFNVGALFLLGGLAAGSPPFSFGAESVANAVANPQMVVPLTMGALAIALNFARELYKSIEDAPHDRSHRRTLPHRLRRREARAIAGAAVLAVIPLSVIPYVLHVFGLLYLVLLTPLLVFLAFIPWQRDAGRASRLVKIGMLVGFIPFLATALI